MKIDFSKIEIFTDISHRNCEICDIREQFGNIIYKIGSGVAAHSLALKIYNSQGDEEYDERECSQIKQFSELCTPAFIDAIGTILTQKTE